MQCGQVDTLIIQGGAQHAIDAIWDGRRVKQARYNKGARSASGILQRVAISKWIARTVRTETYDLIVASYLGILILCPVSIWSSIIFDADDLLKRSSATTRVSWVSRAALEIRNWLALRISRQVRHVWCTTQRDAGLVSTSASVLPNCVEIPAKPALLVDRVPFRLLMVGYLEHRPNLEGLRWFVQSILPTLVQACPATELHVIGKYRAGTVDDLVGAVTFHGFVQDLSTEYARASVVVAPILSGGGSQIKVIDALVHSRPVISSQLAYAGFEDQLVAGRDILVAHDQNSWIAQCIYALTHPAEMERTATAGKAAVDSNLSRASFDAHVKLTLDAIFNPASA